MILPKLRIQNKLSLSLNPTISISSLPSRRKTIGDICNLGFRLMCLHTNRWLIYLIMMTLPPPLRYFSIRKIHKLIIFLFRFVRLVTFFYLYIATDRRIIDSSRIFFFLIFSFFSFFNRLNFRFITLSFLVSSFFSYYLTREKKLKKKKMQKTISSSSRKHKT